MYRDDQTYCDYQNDAIPGFKPWRLFPMGGGAEREFEHSTAPAARVTDAEGIIIFTRWPDLLLAEQPPYHVDPTLRGAAGMHFADFVLREMAGKPIPDRVTFHRAHISAGEATALLPDGWQERVERIFRETGKPARLIVEEP